MDAETMSEFSLKKFLIDSWSTWRALRQAPAPAPNFSTNTLVSFLGSQSLRPAISRD
jgi:hypothetical protein